MALVTAAAAAHARFFGAGAAVDTTALDADIQDLREIIKAELHAAGLAARSPPGGAALGVGLRGHSAELSPTRLSGRRGPTAPAARRRSSAQAAAPAPAPLPGAAGAAGAHADGQK